MFKVTYNISVWLFIHWSLLRHSSNTFHLLRAVTQAFLFTPDWSIISVKTCIIKTCRLCKQAGASLRRSPSGKTDWGVFQENKRWDKCTSWHSHLYQKASIKQWKSNVYLQHAVFFTYRPTFDSHYSSPLLSQQLHSHLLPGEEVVVFAEEIRAYFLWQGASGGAFTHC